MKLPEIAIKNFRFTLLILGLLTLNGLFSFFSMPRSEDPQFTSPGSVIIAIYPGASALEIEEQIVKPVEESLRQIDGLAEVRTTAQDNLATFGIRYEYGSNFDDKFAEIVRELNSAQSNLPEGVTDFQINAFQISDVNIYQFALVSETQEFSSMNAYAQRLKKEIEEISDIRRVQIFGVPEEQITVSVDLQKVANLGIPLSQVLGAIQTNNEKIPSGAVSMGPQTFNVQTNTSFESLSDIEETIVHSAGGKVVHLKDVATVGFTNSEIIHRVRHNGQRAIFVNVQQKAYTNIFTIDKQVGQIVTDFQERLPDDIDFAIAFNQTESVDHRVNEFFVNLLQGIFLVGFLILLIVGVRPSILIMFAIPASIVIGFGFVDLSGFGLQQISIAGLVVALGLLVDNAIVVVENVARFVELGYSPQEAAIKGASQVGWPIISATMTTVFAFVPLLMIQDVSGDFLKSMPATVIFTILASLLVALTLSPYLSSRFFKKGEAHKKTLIQRKLDWVIKNIYQPLLARALARPYLTLIITTVAFVGSISLFGLVGLSFFPKAEKPFILVNVSAPRGTDFERTDEIVRYAESVVAAHEFVEHYSTNIGRENPKIYYNMFPEQRSENVGQILVKTKSIKPRAMQNFISDLRQQFDRYPGASITIREFEQGIPIVAPIVVIARGPDLDMLRQVGDDIKQLIEAIDGTRDVNNPLQTTRPNLQVRINKTRAAALGVTMPEINRTLRTAVGGLPISTYYDSKGKTYDIIVQLKRDGDFKNDDFERIYVNSMTGANIPLGQLSTVEFKSVPTVITHYFFQRSVTITAFPDDNANVNDLTAIITKKLEEHPFPSGYDYIMAGEARAQKRALSGLGASATFAFISVFSILVLQFRSFIQPLIIFTAMPFAVIGSILALFLTGYTASFTAFIGLTSLIGIVVNDSIILVDFANQARREGQKLIPALKAAGEVRFVPIVLTTLTTIGGLLPLTLSGSSLWAPMGWTIIGGLLSSTLLILIVVPALYKILTPDRQKPQPQEQESSLQE